MKCSRQIFFAIFGNFFPFTQKMEISKKWKKYLEITSFYKSAPKLMIIGYSVPEIWHMMDVIVSFHFGLFFCPFTPLKPKKWKYQKIKKIPGGNIILLKCTKNHNHMLYCSWDMVCAGCNCYFSFWAVFYPFTPLAAPKMKISKKWK